MLSKGYRRVLLLDICWVLQSRCEAAATEMSSTPALAEDVEEEEGIHHDQRFEPAGLLLAKAISLPVNPSARLLQGDRTVFATCV